MMLTRDALLDILDYLDASLMNQSKDIRNSTEFQMDDDQTRDFFESQYEIRLQSLLKSKNSGIHQLESGTKNVIIQRRRALIDRII